MTVHRKPPQECLLFRETEASMYFVIATGSQIAGNNKYPVACAELLTAAALHGHNSCPIHWHHDMHTPYAYDTLTDTVWARDKLHKACVLLMYGPVGLIHSFWPAGSIQNWVHLDVYWNSG